MSASLLQMRNLVDLDKETELGDLDTDLLDLRGKGLGNLRTFFQQYIAGKINPTVRWGGGRWVQAISLEKNLHL